jgi:hypothetical protein
MPLPLCVAVVGAPGNPLSIFTLTCTWPFGVTPPPEFAEELTQQACHLVRAVGSLRGRCGSAYFLDRRQNPRSINDRRVCLLGPVESHHKQELALRRRQPIGLMVGARRVVLDQKIG